MRFSLTTLAWLASTPLVAATFVPSVQPRVNASAAPREAVSTVAAPTEADSGWVVREHGGWRSSGLSFGPHKATGIKESGRKQRRSGNMLLGEVRERWTTQFDLADAPDSTLRRTKCDLDRLVSAAANVSRRLEEQRMFGLQCSVEGDFSGAWVLDIDAGIPAPELTTDDVAAGFPIGTLKSGSSEWTLSATGLKRLLPYLWTEPHSFTFHNHDGEVDAVISLRGPRRVWLRAELDDVARASLTRAVVAVLIAKPLVDVDDE